MDLNGLKSVRQKKSGANFSSIKFAEKMLCTMLTNTKKFNHGLHKIY
jgi:hypothetical protein